MGKSKYSAKVEKKIQSSGPKKKNRHVYYDEKIAQKGPGMSKNVFVFLIGMIIIGSGTGFYFILAGNNIDDVDGDPTSTTTATTSTPTTGNVLEAGDRFVCNYKLWKADVAGPSGYIDTSELPIEDSTNTEPLDTTTDRLIPGFTANILGMEEGEEITFTLESGEGYTSGVNAYYRLTFWVQIIKIY